MASWIYNLLHGKLPGKGFLGRSSTGSGPGELLDPAAARSLLSLDRQLVCEERFGKNVF